MLLFKRTKKRRGEWQKKRSMDDRRTGALPPDTGFPRGLHPPDSQGSRRHFSKTATNCQALVCRLPIRALRHKSTSSLRAVATFRPWLFLPVSEFTFLTVTVLVQRHRDRNCGACKLHATVHIGTGHTRQAGSWLLIVTCSSRSRPI
jgi:hypothetical protein